MDSVLILVVLLNSDMSCHRIVSFVLGSRFALSFSLSLVLCIHVCICKYEWLHRNANSLIYSEKCNWEVSPDPTSVFSSPIEEEGIWEAGLCDSCLASLEYHKGNSDNVRSSLSITAG